jgi:hypothetical protein
MWNKDRVPDILILSGISLSMLMEGVKETEHTYTYIPETTVSETAPSEVSQLEIEVGFSSLVMPLGRGMAYTPNGIPMPIRQGVLPTNNSYLGKGRGYHVPDLKRKPNNNPRDRRPQQKPPRFS